jgi:YesN/AraC family two-component response regulator
MEVNMKILVIDSDLHTYIELSVLLKNNFKDIECIDISNSYESAMQMYEEKEYLLVFVDTKLQAKDGFLVIDGLRTINSEVSVIMYGDNLEAQDYRKAVYCKALDVLSKPIEKKALEQSILRFYQSREQKRSQLARDRKQLTQQANDLIEISFVYAVLFNGDLNWERQNYQHLLNISGMGYVIYISLGRDVLSIPLAYERLSKVLKKNVTPGYQCIISKEGARNIIVFVLEKCGLECKRNKSRTEQIRYADFIRKEFHEMFQIDVKIGIGSEKTIEKLPISYEEALRNLRFEHSENMKVILPDDDNEREKEKFYSELEQRFLTNIREGSQEAMNNLIALLDLMNDYGLTEKKNKIMELYVMASHISRYEGKNESEYSNYMELGYQLYNLEPENINAWACRSIRYIIKSVRDLQNIDSFQDIRKVMQYIDNHYDEDITLEEVSSILNLSPQYFSRVFHEKAGVTFVDYLTRIRIKKAKEWLTYSESNVQEVCYKVGYKDPNYFARVFKKTVGMTPRQYKAQKL